MDFALDNTQREIAKLCAQVLDRESGVQESDRSWKAMREAGLLGLAVPERLGGDGLGVLEVAVLLTEVGRRAADVPALALALGVLPIAKYGTDEQQDELLNGDLLLTAAMSEPSNPLPVRPRTTASRDGTGFTVNGTKIAVPHADRADRILVTASTDDGPKVLVVENAEVTGTTVRFTDARAQATDVPVEALHGFALAGACALADGVLAGALDLTIAYVGTRHQFGKPLATFQAVACQIADVYIASRTLHLATLSSCWRLANDEDPELDTAAYWLATEVLPAVHTCHHLHGGVGLDITYPMHRFYGLAKELTGFVGGADHRLDLLAEEETGVR